MGDVNFVASNRVENKISQPRNDDDPRIRLIGLPTLERCTAELHRPIDQPCHNRGSRNWVGF